MKTALQSDLAAIISNFHRQDTKGKYTALVDCLTLPQEQLTEDFLSEAVHSSIDIVNILSDRIPAENLSPRFLINLQTPAELRELPTTLAMKIPAEKLTLPELMPWIESSFKEKKILAMKLVVKIPRKNLSLRALKPYLKSDNADDVLLARQLMVLHFADKVPFEKLFLWQSQSDSPTLKYLIRKHLLEYHADRLDIRIINWRWTTHSHSNNRALWNIVESTVKSIPKDRMTFEAAFSFCTTAGSENDKEVARWFVLKHYPERLRFCQLKEWYAMTFRDLDFGTAALLEQCMNAIPVEDLDPVELSELYWKVYKKEDRAFVKSLIEKIPAKKLKENPAYRNKMVLV